MDELEEYRGEIDKIDEELTGLFCRRMEITGKVGAYKLRAKLPVLDAARQRTLLAAKTALVEDPGRKAEVATLFETIMGISRRQQRNLVHEGAENPGYRAYLAARGNLRDPIAAPRVVYQGEPGAYSEAASMDFFGKEVRAQGLPRFEDAFLALESGRADYAVLPIENSSTGSIRQVYDLLAQYAYHIVGETQVKVEHCLMALPGVELDEITTVYSHEQGLSQSQQFLAGHPAWQQIPTLDTAGSARQVAQRGDRTAAAICSRRAAELYGLNILAEKVNFNAENQTRFVVISPCPERREGCDKISALLTLPHQSGSLHEILTLFAVQGLNLLKLESRPISGRNWEYLFFLEFSGDLSAPGMDGLLCELSQLAADMRILGNFKACGG
ncbi:MAG: bifunctional chorismate mutase/prephenate dehydratase [Pseudoflavonifractor sp.]